MYHIWLIYSCNLVLIAWRRNTLKRSASWMKLRKNWRRIKLSWLNAGSKCWPKALAPSEVAITPSPWESIRRNNATDEKRTSLVNSLPTWLFFSKNKTIGLFDWPSFFKMIFHSKRRHHCIFFFIWTDGSTACLCFLFSSRRASHFSSVPFFFPENCLCLATSLLFASIHYSRRNTATV